jgi:hypothetical protein
MIEMQLLLAFQAGLKVWTQNPFNVNLNFKHKVTTNHVKYIVWILKFFNAYFISMVLKLKTIDMCKLLNIKDQLQYLVHM